MSNPPSGPRSLRGPRAWLTGGLLLSALLGVQAAEVRVRGFVTSDVFATGYGTDGTHQGERFTDHMGSTGWVPATVAGVGRSQSLLASGPSANGSLTLSGTARLGDLAIAGNAMAGIAEPDGIVASAYGGVRAEWVAEMALLSTTLPDGTPVALKFTVVVEGFGVLLDDDAGTNNLLGQFSFGGGLTGLPAGAGRYQCKDFVGSCHYSQTFALTGRVGREYPLHGQLDLLIEAATDRNKGVFTNQALVSAGNSAHLYLDILTAGVTHELGNGSQFEPAPVIATVPEPPVLLLACAALALLALRRCRSGVTPRRARSRQNLTRSR